MTTNVLFTSDPKGESVAVDGYQVKSSGKIVARLTNVVVDASPIPPTLYLMLDGAYFSSDDLRAAIVRCNPTPEVRCDNTVLHAGTQPPIYYGSVPHNGTVILLNPEHLYFHTAALPASPAPAAPAPTTVAPGFVPGVTPSSGLPAAAPAEHAPRFFVHGPTVGVNQYGQGIDAEGRTTGPAPKPIYESEIATRFRVKIVTIDGVDYDGWGNVVAAGTDTIAALDPVYADEGYLWAAIAEQQYKVAVTLTRPDGTTSSSPGFSPADHYVEQPDGRVERIN